MSEASAFDVALKVVDVIILPAIAALAWWLQRQREEVDRLKDDLGKFKTEVAEKRASNGFIVEVRDELRGDVQRLEAKLDRLLELHLSPE